MQLRPHQQRFLDENPDRALLVWSMRTGKSLPAKLWSEDPKRNKNSIVICLKANKAEWVRNCPDATVYTKEEFKKHWQGIANPSCVVVDEVHNFAAPLFIASKRSQQAEALYAFVKQNPQMHFLGLSATPLTNDPASIHTLLCYIGHYIDWKGKFQPHFYQLEYKPFLPRPAYFPKAGWRGEANKLIRKYCDIVSLSDCVEFMPEVEDIVLKVKSTKRKYEDDEEYSWTKDHRHEQLAKLPEIKKLGYRKIILVCKYTEQIDYLASKLKNDKPVFVLDGRTKDQGAVIQEAQESPDAYLIVQSSIGMGWDGYMFDCLVFASMDHRVINHTQMKGRLTNVDNPKPQIFYYMIGGKWDKAVYDSIMAGEDFNIHKYD